MPPWRQVNFVKIGNKFKVSLIGKGQIFIYAKHNSTHTPNNYKRMVFAEFEGDKLWLISLSLFHQVLLRPPFEFLRSKDTSTQEHAHSSSKLSLSFVGNIPSEGILSTLVFTHSWKYRFFRSPKSGWKIGISGRKRHFYHILVENEFSKKRSMIILTTHVFGRKYQPNLQCRRKNSSKCTTNNFKIFLKKSRQPAAVTFFQKFFTGVQSNSGVTGFPHENATVQWLLGFWAKTQRLLGFLNVKLPFLPASITA